MFDGSTYDQELDEVRLGQQLWKVYNVMKDGQWYTLYRLAELTGAPPQSISARVRDFRKPKFGGHTLDSRRTGDPKAGIWEYRLVLRDGAPNLLPPK